MNMLDERENSGMSIQPAKRKRGRPRKDAHLIKQAEAARTPVSEGGTAHLSQRANRTKGTECMVGQAVTGFIEATFDSGYLLTVRIGNSNTNLRGVVFKPGHCVPITAENDIAPHAQMIRRSDVRFPADNPGPSPGRGVHMQTAAVVPSKRKHAPVPQVSPAPPVPATYPSGSQTSDIDVHMVEPLSMLPPGRAIPVGQVFAAAQPY
ncbi:AT hook motif-containing protein, partial [Perilla frutescens var. frutescens]